jgi:hypothetical protein
MSWVKQFSAESDGVPTQNSDDGIFRGFDGRTLLTRGDAGERVAVGSRFNFIVEFLVREDGTGDSTLFVHAVPDAH